MKDVLSRAPAPTVLVVEDDDDHRGLIVRTLSESGAHVHAASHGEQALAALTGVDLVLLDYKLPGMTGLEVLRRIREVDGPSVIMVTGMGSEALVADVMRAGAIDYVVKDPTYFTTLPSVVGRAWRHHELARRADRLQDLALLVTSAVDREAMFTEIVRGARELLAADTCALVLRQGGLELVAQDGRREDVGEVIEQARLAIAVGSLVQEPGRLLVRLPASAGDIVGVLSIRASDPHDFSPEEVRLAETFASFAGIALDRLRRLEIEQALVAELQRTVDQRQEFIASVSHELRTPLACIVGFGETLLNHWQALGEADRLGLIERIGRHAGDLQELVDQLLDVAARQRGRQPRRYGSVRIREVIESAVGDLEPLLEGREVSVEAPDLEVVGDAHTVGRVLANLISNAAKYSEPRQPIRIQAIPAGSDIRVEVRDRGVGLDLEDASRVFEPFWRARYATATATRGTGIGLALVREYVSAMGGTVGVESDLGVGSTFWFTLPLAATAPEIVGRAG